MSILDKQRLNAALNHMQVISVHAYKTEFEIWKKSYLVLTKGVKDNILKRNRIFLGRHQ